MNSFGLSKRSYSGEDIIKLFSIADFGLGRK